jgi:chorismate mutase
LRKTIGTSTTVLARSAASNHSLVQSTESSGPAVVTLPVHVTELEAELTSARATISAQSTALTAATQERQTLSEEVVELRKRNEAVERVVRERLAAAVTEWREGYVLCPILFVAVYNLCSRSASADAPAAN